MPCIAIRAFPEEQESLKAEISAGHIRIMAFEIPGGFPASRSVPQNQRGRRRNQCRVTSDRGQVVYGPAPSLRPAPSAPSMATIDFLPFSSKPGRRGESDVPTKLPQTHQGGNIFHPVLKYVPLPSSWDNAFESLLILPPLSQAVPVPFPHRPLPNWSVSHGRQPTPPRSPNGFANRGRVPHSCSIICARLTLFVGQYAIRNLSPSARCTTSSRAPG